MIEKFIREAVAADVFADRFRDDLELHTQYSTEARVWRQAARLIGHIDDFKVTDAELDSCLERAELAERLLKGRIGCHFPDTCGGPTLQPACEPCIEFAKRWVWKK